MAYFYTPFSKKFAALNEQDCVWRKPISISLTSLLINTTDNDYPNGKIETLLCRIATRSGLSGLQSAVISETPPVA